MATGKFHLTKIQYKIGNVQHTIWEISFDKDATRNAFCTQGFPQKHHPEI